MARIAEINRKTNETNISADINLESGVKSVILTGIGFLDHMIEQLTFHSGIALNLKCDGDLEIDDHHSVEDIAIVIGDVLLKALGDKKGIERYGHAYVPMDETLVRVVLDLSGRSEFCFQGGFTDPKIGELSTQMIEHFFKSVASRAGITLHMSILYGQNDHHKSEALFKAFGRALKIAIKVTGSNSVSSTKGVL